MKKVMLICILAAFCAATAFAGDSTDVKEQTEKAAVKATDKATEKTTDKAAEKAVKEVAPEAAKPEKAKDAEKKEPEVITTKSGLKYIVYEEGEGEVAEKGMTVKVHYTGWLSDKGEKGTKFDSSYDRQKPLPFKLGAGGPIGSGRQFWPWIDIDDVCGITAFVLEQDELKGPVNAVAPEQVRCKQFTSTLGRVLGRPAIVPLPAFAARLALGEMADGLLLASTRVRPAMLEKAGYTFRSPDLETALTRILGR